MKILKRFEEVIPALTFEKSRWSAILEKRELNTIEGNFNWIEKQKNNALSLSSSVKQPDSIISKQVIRD